LIFVFGGFVDNRGIFGVDFGKEFEEVFLGVLRDTDIVGAEFLGFLEFKFVGFDDSLVEGFGIDERD